MDPHEIMLGYANHHSMVPLDVRNYPAGEPLVGAPRFHPAFMVVRPKSMETFMAAMFYADACRWRGLPPMALFLPAVPGSRQDRLNPRDDMRTGDDLFTLRSVAEMVNARGFTSVHVTDPHSDVTAALIERCVVHTAAECFPGPRVFQAVVAPDAGAAKRAQGVASAFGVPVLQAWKKRDVATGKLSGFGLEDTTGIVGLDHYVLVVDDICDGGGTFLGLAEVLADRGIRADLAVTHGYFTQGTAALSEAYENIHTTDSVIADFTHEGVRYWDAIQTQIDNYRKAL